MLGICTLALISLTPLSHAITFNSNPIPLVPGSTPPPGFKFELGAWILDPDTNAGFNEKLSRKLPSWQAAMSIPYRVNATGTYLDPLYEDATHPYSLVTNWNDGTDASVFMTIYADQTSPGGVAPLGMDLVSDESIMHLAQNLVRITQQTGRKVFMRWLPEMNGSWMWYGNLPDQYVALWKRMHSIFKTYAKEIPLVWSPNFDLNSGDTSFWPGAQYVDMVGTSVYYKGWGVNDLVPSNYTAASITTVYREYAELYNLPFVISECSGAWETGAGKNPVTGAIVPLVRNAVDQPTFQKSFWESLLAPEVFAAFPLLTRAYLFEVAKMEEFFSDFRVTNDSATLNAFKSVVANIDAQGYLVWANESSSNSNSPSETSQQTTRSPVFTSTETPNAKSSAFLVTPLALLLFTNLAFILYL